ncbi:MAG: type II toxin-antitoxin system YafQ family toxin [Synergistaceae bacterium]|nr:type II toxin-antitoxin system YafQ family toxin [Synergistaceae bacterium]
MLNLEYQTQFKKDMKTIIKRGLDINLLKKVVDMLQNSEKLPEVYRYHQLSGRWSGYRDCHIKSDWILIYEVIEEANTLRLVRTGSHSDIGLA